MSADQASTATETTAGAASGVRGVPVGRYVGWAVFLLLAAVVVVFRPMNAGGFTSYEFVSGVSMEPSMHTGDLAIVMPQAEYRTGDVISYHPSVVPQGAIIHRIVGGDAASGFVVQGDNRATPDPDRPRPDMIVGKAVLVVPQAGWIFNALRERAVLAALGVAVLLFVAWDVVRSRRRNRAG